MMLDFEKPAAKVIIRAQVTNSDEPSILHHEKRRLWWVFVCVVLVYVCLACFRLGAVDLGIDEARFGLSGLNILADIHQLATVSEDPLGGPGTKPYMYPLSIAGSIVLFGKTEFAVRIVDVVALALSAWFLYSLVLVLTTDRMLALCAGSAFLLNPATLTYARIAMPEPLVVLWGTFALFALAKLAGDAGIWWAPVCGASLGCGFLAKFWLVLPFGLACFCLLCLQARKRCVSQLLAWAVLIGVSAVVVAASHLLFVMWLTPGDLPYWENIYGVFSFKGRVAGANFDPQMWYRPWWFYPASLFRATFFALPLAITGMVALLKERKTALGVVVCALLSPVVMLSLFRVKQATYTFSAVSGAAILIAAGGLYFLREASLRTILPSSAVSALIAAVAYRAGVIGLSELALIVCLYSSYSLAAWSLVDRGSIFRAAVTVAAVAAMLFADSIVIRKSLEHRTYYREIAQYVKPTLSSSGPRDQVFIAPEFPVMEFYTYRSGKYWETYYHPYSYEQFTSDMSLARHQFYVVDPSGVLYGSKLSTDELAAFDRYAIDVTPSVERSIGYKMSVKVLVPTHSGERRVGTN